MKSIEEIGKIFIEEAKDGIDQQFDYLCKVTNDIINKTDNAENEYNILCKILSDKLPKRGITKEELQSFMPHIRDYIPDIAKYILQKFNMKGDDESGSKA